MTAKNYRYREIQREMELINSTPQKRCESELNSLLSLSTPRTVFRRPFVKRFALCYQTVVCLSVLSCQRMLAFLLLYVNAMWSMRMC